jgi:hypothetical protein
MLNNNTTNNPTQQNIPTTFLTLIVSRRNSHAYRNGWQQVSTRSGELSILQNCIVDEEGKVQCPPTLTQPAPTTLI